MRLRFFRRAPLPSVLSGAAWLVLTVSAEAAELPCTPQPLCWPAPPCITPPVQPMPAPAEPPAQPAQPAAPSQPTQPSPAESMQPQVPQDMADQGGDFQGPSQFAASGGAGGSANMMGDLISGSTLRCVLVPRVVTVPVTRVITPPPVLVSPPAFTSTFTATGTPPAISVTPPSFTFTPVGSVQPPPVLVQPPPIRLPDGRTVPVAPYFVTPAAVGVSDAPVTVQPQTFLAQPPTEVVTAGPVAVQPQSFLSQPAPVTVTDMVQTIVFEQQCAAVVTAAARASAFKIAENESPQPQDRIYLGFNYFDNVNDAVNQRMGDHVNNMQVFRETIGGEMTFFDGWTSIETRVPVSTLQVSSDVPGLGGTNNDIGDISMGLKAALFWNQDTGDLVSSGFVVTAPTGSREFNPFNSWILQPWVGYRYFFTENGYIHGFCSIAVPTDSQDVTLLFNDVGVGYFVYRNPCPDARINAIIPTVEAHVNTPLNHRGAFDFADPSGTPDWVVITCATTFQICQWSTLALGAGIPVTGPKPYDYEALAQYNLRF